MKYDYLVRGTSADDQTWTVTGSIDNVPQGGFMEAQDQIMKQVFYKLTHGKAVYGRPGVGCNGPYTITHLVIDDGAEMFNKPWDQKTDDEKFDEWQNGLDGYKYLRDWNSVMCDKMEEFADIYTKWDTGVINEEQYHDAIATIGSWWINVNSEPEEGN